MGTVSLYNMGRDFRVTPCQKATHMNQCPSETEAWFVVRPNYISSAVAQNMWQKCLCLREYTASMVFSVGVGC